jgi:E3 ubiquitin-protein ligase UBR1
VNHYIFKEREADLSLDHLGVQLFTSPSIALGVVKSTDMLKYLMYSMKCFFTTDGVHVLSLNDDIYTNRNYFSALGTLTYVLSFKEVQEIVSHQHGFLKSFLDFIHLFEGIYPNLRYAHLHIEYESDTWIFAFWMTHQLIRIIPLVAKSFNASMDSVETAIMMTMKLKKDIQKERFRAIQFAFVKSHLIDHKEELEDYVSDIEIPQFAVSSEPTSFHNPLCWLLGRLLEEYAILLSESTSSESLLLEKLKALLCEVDQEISFPDFIKVLMEKPLRGMCCVDIILATNQFIFLVMVLLSQIRQRLWVRNGYGIKNQVNEIQSECLYNILKFLLGYLLQRCLCSRADKRL